MIEHLWNNSFHCEGKTSRTAVLPNSVAWCPASAHHSPFSLDLERFVPKLQRDHPSFFKSNATARAAITEYKKMLRLMQRYPDQPAVPSKLVDLVWHEHILDTVKYKSDTLRMFGSYIHHKPSFGGAEEKLQLVQQKQAMLKNYKDEFGTNPGSIWSVSEPGDIAKQKSPDCCQAFCVKPDCASCVGCNALDCGYLSGNRGSTVQDHLAPERFGGYVPTQTPIDPSTVPTEQYLCSVSPHRGTNLSWSIHDGYIYFKETFEGEAWYGIGLNNFTQMSLADYNIVMQTRNYSGVKDLYKWDAGNGYPCFDVEYECSGKNGTKGSYDVEDAEVQRLNGFNTATWNRKLITGDSKDFPITNKTIGVLFANGVEDYFTFHAQNYGGCTLNFMSGQVSYCFWKAKP